jgi:thiol-disulfide isomerase/thioredoxin
VRRLALGAAVCAYSALVSACTRVDEPLQADPAASPPVKTASASPPAASSPAPPPAPPPPQAPLPAAKTGKLSWSRAPAGDVATLVRGFAEAARAAGRAPLVYVGAPWCEPCQRFHKAAERGELDRRFGDLAILEFNLDVDSERLRAAGYTADLIPLLAIPAADGRSTEQKMFGSVKGDGAVANMTPRLAALLGR